MQAKSKARAAVFWPTGAVPPTFPTAVAAAAVRLPDPANISTKTQTNCVRPVITTDNAHRFSDVEKLDNNNSRLMTKTTHDEIVSHHFGRENPVTHIIISLVFQS